MSFHWLSHDGTKKERTIREMTKNLLLSYFRFCDDDGPIKVQLKNFKLIFLCVIESGECMSAYISANNSIEHGWID